MRPMWNRLVRPLRQIGNHDGFVERATYLPRCPSHCRRAEKSCAKSAIRLAGFSSETDPLLQNLDGKKVAYA
jgi:hypothetical protein